MITIRAKRCQTQAPSRMWTYRYGKRRLYSTVEKDFDSWQLLEVSEGGERVLGGAALVSIVHLTVNQWILFDEHGIRLHRTRTWNFDAVLAAHRAFEKWAGVGLVTKYDTGGGLVLPLPEDYVRQFYRRRS